MFFVLFVGPWSDNFGRKFLIISPLVGFVILDVVFLLNSIFFYELKADWIILEFIQDLSGKATKNQH